MRILHLLALLMSVLLLLSGGCDKKKEQAAELEKELMGEEALTDSAIPEAEPPASLAEELGETPTAKPDAVPAETERPETIALRNPGGHTVQVAACESREYAEFLVRKFAKRGYEPFMSQTVANGQTYYRVRIGDFATRPEAEALRTELIDKYSLVGAWIDAPH